MNNESLRRLPVTVLCGSLGAGKTCGVRAWRSLSDPFLRWRLAVPDLAGSQIC